MNYLEESDSKARVAEFLESLIQIFKTYKQFDRISVPFLDVLDIFVGTTSLIYEEHASLYSKLVEIVQKIVYKNKEIRKLKAAIKVYSTFASLDASNSFEEVVKTTTKKLVGYLSHPFPLGKLILLTIVRRLSSEHLHMAISSRCIDETMEFGELESLILNTDW